MEKERGLKRENKYSYRKVLGSLLHFLLFPYFIRRKYLKSEYLKSFIRVIFDKLQIFHTYIILKEVKSKQNNIKKLIDMKIVFLLILFE